MFEVQGDAMSIALIIFVLGLLLIGIIFIISNAACGGCMNVLVT